MKKKVIIHAIFIVLFLLGGVYISITFYPDVYISKPYYLEISNIDDELIYSYSRNYQGKYVELKDVSECFIKTLINTEDKHFYSHHGFDYPRIIKSIFSNAEAGEIKQGGSTITQQLARTIYLSNQKSFSRKINEAYIAKKIENKYSKDYILELYINTVYFAHNLYGLGAASEYYFHKSPKELNFQESCLLVGVINAPNIYSPFIDLEASNKKQKEIAYLLYKNEIINIHQYYEILSKKSTLYGEETNVIDINSYYFQGVIQELKNKEIFMENDQEIGLKVQTYFDKKIQNIISKLLVKYCPDDQTSIIVMKPNSGHILALSGGNNYNISSFNRALNSKRQIGSTIKPLIYYLSLINGLNPLSEFSSKPITFNLSNGITYTPKNSNDIYAYRNINMIEAIAMSDNIYAVKCALLVGTNSIINLINQFNIKVDKPNITLALGSIEMSPLELCSIYNTFASKGDYYSPTFIKKVSYSTGANIYSNTNSHKRIFKLKECLIMDYLLQSPFDRGLITYSTPTMANYQVNNSYCVKTGTTDYSSWVVGFNPNYTVLVYAGDDDNKGLHNSKITKQIFRDLINYLDDDQNIFFDYDYSFTSFKFHNPIYNTYSKTYIRSK